MAGGTLGIGQLKEPLVEQVRDAPLVFQRVCRGRVEDRVWVFAEVVKGPGNRAN